MGEETIKARRLYELAEPITDFLRENYSENVVIEISRDFVRAAKREEKVILMVKERRK